VHQQADPPSYCAWCASTVQTEVSLAGAWKQLRWSLDCGQGPGDCSRRMDQQWQKAGGRTCWVGYVVCAVDFAQRNGDVSGWTVGRSERRGTEVPDRSGIDLSVANSSALLQNIAADLRCCCWFQKLQRNIGKSDETVSACDFFAATTSTRHRLWTACTIMRFT